MLLERCGIQLGIVLTTLELLGRRSSSSLTILRRRRTVQLRVRAKLVRREKARELRCALENVRSQERENATQMRSPRKKSDNRASYEGARRDDYCYYSDDCDAVVFL